MLSPTFDNISELQSKLPSFVINANMYLTASISGVSDITDVDSSFSRMVFI